jgi:hypothetical protein
MRANVILIALLLTACASPGGTSSAGIHLKPKELQVSGPYRHKYLGMSFPESVGPMMRTDVIQFDAEGADIAANYIAKDRQLFGTAYAYPILDKVSSVPADFAISAAESDQQCKRFFDSAASLAMKQYTGSVVQESRTFSLPQRPNYTGYRLVFDADRRIPSPGQPNALIKIDGPLTSELYLLCKRGTYWHLKYRLTYARGAAVQNEIDRWLAAVPTE